MIYLFIAAPRNRFFPIETLQDGGFQQVLKHTKGPKLTSFGLNVAGVLRVFLWPNPVVSQPKKLRCHDTNSVLELIASIRANYRLAERHVTIIFYICHRCLNMPETFSTFLNWQPSWLKYCVLCVFTDSTLTHTCQSWLETNLNRCKSLGLGLSLQFQEERCNGLVISICF